MNRAATQLWYGVTGVGKTSQIGRVARWWYERNGTVSRLISGDSGWGPCDQEISEGIIEPWNIQGLSAQDPRPVLIYLSEGYWPQADIGKIRMVAPTLQDGRLTTKDGKTVGCYFIEGLQTISSMLLQDHIRNQRKIGQDVVGSWNESITLVGQDGKDVVKTVVGAKAAPSHYGQVQEQMLLDLVPRFARLPVDLVVWTSHEAKGEDDKVDGRAILGPASVGVAAVGRTPQCFADTFHLTANNQYQYNAQTKQAKLVEDYRAYFVSHPDVMLTQMNWPAKLSLSLERKAELLKLYPQGFLPLGGMEKYFEFKHPLK